jgi:hypothetical protein
MAVFIQYAGDNTYLVRATGVFRPKEFAEAQSVAARGIDHSGPVKVLFMLEGFEGWEPGAGWDDTSFYLTHGKDIKKIAIVGEDRWRDEALMFAGAGLRKAPVEYFTPDQSGEARVWLTH